MGDEQGMRQGAEAADMAMAPEAADAARELAAGTTAAAAAVPAVKAFDPNKHVIRVQGNREYLPASARLVWFRQDHPDWGIVTQPLEINLSPAPELKRPPYAIFTAPIFSGDGKVMATAHKYEDVKGFPDFLEKAETGAISRALAMCGYGTQFAPELEEGEQRLADSPRTAPGQPQHRPGPLRPTGGYSGPGRAAVPAPNRAAYGQNPIRSREQEAPPQQQEQQNNNNAANAHLRSALTNEEYRERIGFGLEFANLADSLGLPVKNDEGQLSASRVEALLTAVTKVQSPPSSTAQDLWVPPVALWKTAMNRLPRYAEQYHQERAHQESQGTHYNSSEQDREE